MEHFNGLEYVVRSELVNFNGVDLVYSEGGDDVELPADAQIANVCELYINRHSLPAD